MSPDQCKRDISIIYTNLKIRVDAGKLNEGAMHNIIESHCRDAARHGGVPECWRNYLPDALQSAQPQEAAR